MENKTNMIPDEKLETVTGGAGTQPTPRFQVGDFVRVEMIASNGKKSCSAGYFTGRVIGREYDETLGAWTYLVETGYKLGATWYAFEGSAQYYPDQRLRQLPPPYDPYGTNT